MSVEIVVPDLARSVKREMWYRGNLRYLTREGPQRRTYDLIHQSDKRPRNFGPWVLNFHRRLGKTFLGLLFCIERCLRERGSISKFGAPSFTMASDILEEHWPIFMEECPEALIPRGFRGEKYTFRNERWMKTDFDKSVLKLYGVNNDDGNKMRGGSSDIVVLDECREMGNLEYTWGSVLLPTFRGRKDPIGIMLSTPPESTEHTWCSKYIPEAEARNRYFCCPASEDPNWTEEEDEMMAREMGGRDSSTYRREIECHLISNAQNLIIPEFSAGDVYRDGKLEENYFVHETWKRPEYYYAFVVGDMSGGADVDHNGILFAFIDFPRKKLVIESELWLHDRDTATLAAEWKERTSEVFPRPESQWEHDPIVDLQHWADSRPQQLIDLYRLYDLAITQVPKTDRDAARNRLRTAFNRDRISVSSKCEELIFQLRNGCRTKTGDFQRSARVGHCDLIAALIYAYRIAEDYLERNPFPKPKIDRDNIFTIPRQPETGWGRYFRKMRRAAF